MNFDKMGEHDIDSALRSGYFQSSLAKNLDMRSRKNTLTIPRSINWAARFPPPPSVEDESEALAREAGPALSSISSEEPVHRGDPDQYPIILPVHEYNPERRFVLVSNQTDSSTDSADSADSEKRPTRRRRSAEQATAPESISDTYEANTGRRYEPDTPLHEEQPIKRKGSRRESERRRSRHEDLPRIITDPDASGQSRDTRRAKSRTRSDARGDDHISPRPSFSSRQARGSFLSPEVIEHATAGRDRSYHRGGSGSNNTHGRNKSPHPVDQYSRNSATEYRSKDRDVRAHYTTSPVLQKRHTSEIPKHSRRDSNQSRESTRRLVDASPQKKRPERNFLSSTSSQSDHDSSPQRPSGAREKRTPSQHPDVFFSSEDETRPQHTDRRRRKSVLPPSKADYLSTPMDSWGKDRQKPRGPSPLPAPSPRVSHHSVSDPYASTSNSRSATFPKEQKSSRDEGRSRAERPLSRSTTATGSFSAARNVIPVIGMPMATTAAAVAASTTPVTVDQSRSAAPPARVSPIAKPKALPPTPSASLSTPMSAPIQPTWPPSFEPGPGNSAMGSYRRYSVELEQRQNGELPDIPSCPRTKPEAGYLDWLTLPRCDNFNICPSCYVANFSETEFAHDFVPVPFRPRDRPLACDFGTSEYYRIAWLLTRKYGRRDLGLMHGLVSITAQAPPCSGPHGPHEANRAWYGIRDPRTGRPVENFAICVACAKTVEMLLLGFGGLFSPLDASAEPADGLCAFAPATSTGSTDSGNATTHNATDGGHARFLIYFDALEGSADRAQELRTTLNVQALADRMRELSGGSGGANPPPCPGGRAVRNGTWYTMRSVPGMTACPACFTSLVRPLLHNTRDKERDKEWDRGLVVVGDFHAQPVVYREGDCLLFSERMRGVFLRAVRNGDLRYLDMKVRERADKERECVDMLEAVKRQGAGTPWAEAETAKIINEWKKFE
ncbi:hypothetical protein GGS20DRAFT_550777 [Poronia punctata]|nr:hypothetical protein GGS20DRAFT_550777 [Poronia punctata]